MEILDCHDISAVSTLDHHLLLPGDGLLVDLVSLGLGVAGHHLSGQLHTGQHLLLGQLGRDAALFQQVVVQVFDQLPFVEAVGSEFGHVFLVEVHLFHEFGEVGHLVFWGYANHIRYIYRSIVPSLYTLHRLHPLVVLQGTTLSLLGLSRWRDGFQLLEAGHQEREQCVVVFSSLSDLDIVEAVGGIDDLVGVE